MSSIRSALSPFFDELVALLYSLPLSVNLYYFMWDRAYSGHTVTPLSYMKIDGFLHYFYFVLGRTDVRDEHMICRSGSGATQVLIWKLNSVYYKTAIIVKYVTADGFKKFNLYVYSLVLKRMVVTLRHRM